jgi:hypothetical protein
VITKNALEQAAKRVGEVREALAANAHSGSQFDKAKHEELVDEFGHAIKAYMELIQRLSRLHANG